MVTAAADLGDAAVVDLFAGSGALGIEALSRGAATATFVESDRRAVDTIKANLATLAMVGPWARVVRGDALRWAASASALSVPGDGTSAVAVPGDGTSALSVPGDGIVLALADPPYQFARWDELLSSLGGWADLIALESGAAVELGPAWAPVRVRRYGATVVSIARPAHAPATSPRRKGGT